MTDEFKKLAVCIIFGFCLLTGILIGVLYLVDCINDKIAEKSGESNEQEDGIYIVYDIEDDKYYVYHDPYCDVELISY